MNVPLFLFSLTGWTLKTKTTFGKDSPIFLLGSCYTIRPDGKYIDIINKSQHVVRLTQISQLGSIF